MVQPLWKTVWWFLKKLNISLLFCPVILHLAIYTELHIFTQNLYSFITLFMTAKN